MTAMNLSEVAEKLDWEVEKFQLTAPEGYPLKGFYGVRRKPTEDKPKPPMIGKSVKEAYRVVQNRELIQVFSELEDKGFLTVNGYLNYGDKGIVITGETDREWKIFDESQDVLRLNIVGSLYHGGTGGVGLMPSPQVVACKNQMAGIMKGASRIIKFRHTLSQIQTLRRFPEMLERAENEVLQLREGLQSFDRKKISGRDLEEFIRQSLNIQSLTLSNDVAKAIKEKEEIEKTKNLVAKVMESYVTEESLIRPKSRGTVYHAFQSVTHYVDHNKKGEQNRAYLSLFGDGSKVRERAWGLAKAA